MVLWTNALPSVLLVAVAVAVAGLGSGLSVSGTGVRNSFSILRSKLLNVRRSSLGSLLFVLLFMVAALPSSWWV